MKFARVLGVLRKTNRDLKSEHWKPEWVPILADHQGITSDVEAMRSAAERMLGQLASILNIGEKQRKVLFDRWNKATGDEDKRHCDSPPVGPFFR